METRSQHIIVYSIYIRYMVWFCALVEPTINLCCLVKCQSVANIVFAWVTISGKCGKTRCARLNGIESRTGLFRLFEMWILIIQGVSSNFHSFNISDSQCLLASSRAYMNHLKLFLETSRGVNVG